MEHHRESIVIDMTRLAAREPATPEQLQNLYKTLPLPLAQCIRVIDVSHIAPGGRSLSGTLRVMDLTTSPAFTALSYVWGLPGADNQDTICCNGVDVPVTANCCEALLALAHIHGGEKKKGDERQSEESAAGTAFTIWVDAICINQKDDAEKELQIPLMQDIYTWAQAVYIWLGPGNKASDRAVDWLSEASTFQPAFPGIPWVDGNGVKTFRQDRAQAVRNYMRTQFQFVFFHLFRGLLKPQIRKRQQILGDSIAMQPKDLEALLSCKWLRRAWTFQEIMLASNPVVIRGNKAISWNVLFVGLRVLFSQPGSNMNEIWSPYRVAETWMQDTRLPYAQQQVVHDWVELFGTWLGISRPTLWNGISQRILPPGATSEEGGRLSVQLYHERAINIPRVCYNATVMWLVINCTAEAVILIAASLTLHLGASALLPLAVGVLLVIAATHLAPGCALLPFFAWFKYKVLKQSMAQSSVLDGTKSMSLASVLQALRERDSSRAEDRVYATHGVLRSLGFEPPPPDYAQSLGRVYHDFFAKLLVWRPTMINLLADVGGSPLVDAPSWVPNWKTLVERTWLSSEKLHSSIDKTEDEEPLPAVTISGSELTIRGVTLGTVTFASGPLESCTCGSAGHGTLDANDAPSLPCGLPASMLKLSAWVAAIKNDAPVSAGVYDSIPRAVSDALTADREPTAEENVDFNLWYRALESSRLANNAQRMGLSAETQAQAIMDCLSNKPKTLDFAVRIIESLSGRRGVFFSQDGHVGSGPPGVAEGDVMAILDGVCTPTILRRAGAGTGSPAGSNADSEPDRYKVLGPAFVCGFKDVKDVTEYKPASDAPQRESMVLV